MKRQLAALLAASALALAVPAAASAHENGYGNSQSSDWDRGDGGYNNFRQEFQHLYDGVQHGLEDGSYSRGEARQFFWQINSLRQRLDYFRGNDGYLSPREAQDIQYRLTRLHEVLHAAHEDGHDQYSGYGDRRGDDGYRDNDRDGRSGYYYGNRR